MPTMPRALNKLICRVLIGVFLFAQLAVAGHACPLQGQGQGQPTSQAVEAQAEKPDGMPSGCDQMDRNAANLCAEHCHFGQQSSDTAPLPVVFAPLPALLYVLPTEPESADGSVRPLLSADPLLAAAPPPHAILHCVLRI
jgi:hypothetical protein